MSSPLRTRALLPTLVLFGACFTSTDDHTLGSASPSYERCVAQSSSTFGVVCATVTPAVCNGVTCAGNEVCCLTTGACVARGSDACPSPPPNDLNGLRACASNNDCASDEYCVADDYSGCVGSSGHCRSITTCGFCGPPGSKLCEVCGCNGVTYASDQEACVAGVHAPNRGACGVASGQLDGGAFTISCGTNEQCPPGAKCCFGTGKCFDSSEPWRCEKQPNGSLLNCASHGECNLNVGGGSGANDARLCDGATCGEPGVCSNRPQSSSCSGEVHEVCGCDGVSYINECWARSSGVRVASNGMCP